MMHRAGGPLRKEEKDCGGTSRAEARPLQRLSFGFSGFAVAGFGGADFAHGGVSSSLTGAPHVPTRDGAVGTPAFTKGEQFFGFGHVLFAVGDGPAFLDSQVMDRENIRAAETENQKHFDGPGADAANGD